MKIWHVFLSTAMGLGFSPLAPGTAGALGGCIIACLLRQYTIHHAIILLFLIILFFFLGIHSSGKLEKEWGKDPSKVVIDEVVGMWISMLMIPSGWIYALAAFILFRLLDIFKPFFIRKMERLKGGWGIMMDDVLAGIYANVIIQLFYSFNNRF